MKFFQLDLIRWDKNGQVYPKADPTRTCESLARKYFKGNIIRNDNYIDDAPLFNYFSMMSVSHNNPYDWILNDAHNFSGAFSPVVRGWLVSEFFKTLLENFNIAQPFRFYPAKLMFQGIKQDYFIFQVAHQEWESIDFDKSEFFYWSREGLNEKVPKGLVKTYDEMYPEAKTKVDDVHTFVDMKVSKAVVDKYYDMIVDFNSANGLLISEPLKIAIEQAQITGVFTELYTMTEFFFKDRPNFG